MNTNHTDIHESFLQLVRLGIGTGTVNGSGLTVHGSTDWQALKVLADEQGLSAIVLDGIDRLQLNGLVDYEMPLQMKLEWIGEVLQGEQTYKLQHEVAKDMSSLFHANAIRTYVLKGDVIAECYPKPNHRVSVDIDCFLLPGKGDFDAWSLGNDLVQTKGFSVNTDFYKNSSFDISGVNIENHQYLTPFRGNVRLASLEKLLQAYLRQDKGDDVFEETHLYRPPVMVSALFLIEHAYSHFLHEGLTWRMVLDWVMFSRKHKDEIDWEGLDKQIDEFGFRKFYDSYSRLGRLLTGEITTDGLHVTDRKMLEDIWNSLDLHETVRGVKGKLALAGNTWRARWKYRYFSDISWVTALWIQVKGFLFEKNPTLN